MYLLLCRLVLVIVETRVSSEKRDSDGFLQRPSKSFAAAYGGS